MLALHHVKIWKSSICAHVLVLNALVEVHRTDEAARMGCNPHDVG